VNDRFIVTGGAGLIGANIALRLRSLGASRLTIVDHLNHPAKQRNLDLIRPDEFIDKTDFRRRINAGPVPDTDTVFHMGACSSTTQTDTAYLHDNNFLYSRDLCNLCLRLGKRFIYASSAATYGDGALGYSDSPDLIPRLQPLNPYGRSKQMFDLWLLEQRLLDRVAGLKFFNVYGPLEDHKADMRSVVLKAFEQISATGRLNLFQSHDPRYRDGEQLRDFVYVRDAVNVCLFFHEHPAANGIFNCGTGTARSWLDLARAVFSAMQRTPEITFIEMPPAIREKYQYHTEADISRLRLAGYAAPFAPIETGVLDYVASHLQRTA
jgi:ADP-L-glycero-D-manno-heptose 6-epimerase